MHVLDTSCMESATSSECTNSTDVILAECASVHSEIVSRSSISVIKTAILDMRRFGRSLLVRLVKINSFLSFGNFLMKSLPLGASAYCNWFCLKFLDSVDHILIFGETVFFWWKLKIIVISLLFVVYINHSRCRSLILIVFINEIDGMKNLYFIFSTIFTQNMDKKRLYKTLLLEIKS